jgi:general stress protein 26
MKTTTAADDPKSFEKLQELVRAIEIAMVTTVTVDGALRSRPMITRRLDEDGTLWFFSADDAGIAHDLDGEHAVNIAYADPHKQRYVSVTGNATLVHNRRIAAELWQSALRTYFPHGLDDPHLALLSVKIETAEYWDSPSSKLARLFEASRATATGTKSESGEHTKVEVRAARESG